MATAMGNVAKGGSFLIAQTDPAEVFTPEDFSEEHLMIASTVEDFVEREVLPHLEEIEHKDFDLTVKLLRRAAELGLLSLEVPEKYGGLGLDKISGLIVSEKLGRCASFGVSYGAHAGIGTWPIVYFGTEEQKRRYLPRFASGELISAYALTEPGSGSDALAAKTRAVLSADGRYYVLNGTKMWITNAAFADVFIVFAKVDGEKFTAFIVERNYPGVSTGKEEPKMGIEGSSTRALILEDARVPVENVLGEIGRGHKVAFNCLNLGRFRLGAGCIGGCKTALKDAAKYARERHQFGRPIASFGAIKHKLGEMAIRTWVGESTVYRTGGMMNAAFERIDKDNPEEAVRAIEEYAVECSMMKVIGSEFLDYVVDEAVQIFGGYGYSREYPVERYYRDARINRIFEGTNEINRLLIPGMLFKRAEKGHLPLFEAAQRLISQMLSEQAPEDEGDELLGAEKGIVANAKKIALFVGGAAFQKFRDQIAEQQEVLCCLSDIVMETYAMESALLRALKLAGSAGAERVRLQIDMARSYINDAIYRVDLAARQALAAMSEGDALRTQLAALRRFTRHMPINAVNVRRRVADAIVEAGRYCF